MITNPLLFLFSFPFFPPFFFFFLLLFSFYIHHIPLPHHQFPFFHTPNVILYSFLFSSSPPFPIFIVCNTTRSSCFTILFSISPLLTPNRLPIFSPFFSFRLLPFFSHLSELKILHFFSSPRSPQWTHHQYSPPPHHQHPKPTTILTTFN